LQTFERPLQWYLLAVGERLLVGGLRPPFCSGCRRRFRVSGEVGADPTGTIIGPSIGEQTDQALTNIGHILGAAGLTLDNVVATTVYLVNVSDFAEMNAHYATFFKNAPPSRATVQVAALPKKGALVEISAIAVIPTD